MGDVTIVYVDRQWPVGCYREGVRNSNLFKIREALEDCTYRGFESALLLDDDMLIVNKNFVDGFWLAEKFGAALPLNPRTFQLYNLMGADVSDKDYADLEDAPLFAPAHNFSPMFVSLKNPRALYWLTVTGQELRDKTCRGTLAIWKTMLRTGFTPVNLPMQWCVCGAEADYYKNYMQRLRGRDMPIPPIMLHLGHEETRRVFRELIDEVTH